MVAVYSENHMKPSNIFLGENAVLLIIKAGGTYSPNYAFKV
jgi:hypothetical protein